MLLPGRKTSNFKTTPFLLPTDYVAVLRTLDTPDPADQDLVGTVEMVLRAVRSDLYQAKTVEEMQQLQGDEQLNPAVIYRITGRRAPDTTALPDLIIGGLSNVSLWPEGVLDPDTSPVVVAYNLVTDTTTARVGGASDTITFPVTRALGGYAIGDIVEVVNDATGLAFKQLLAPENPPVIQAFTASNTPRQYGASTAVALSFQAAAGVNTPAINVAQVKVNGVIQLNGDGTPKLSGTVNVNTAADTDTSYTMEVTDADGTKVSRTIQVDYSSKRFWGALSTDPATMSAAELSAALKALVTQEFSESRSQLRTITLANQYPVFAYRASAGVPTVTVGGRANNNFRNAAFTFTNSENTPESFLWVAGSLNTGTFTFGLS
ncbi:hypothetical protein HER32_12000 [Hymenobacter sp. BT18]|uniref:hypothetical protein n=1 Tax=Hymenobacter sp. BT18 TaxID=2835648 RepID=UPI00143E6949|nr:hypothetical protein [Hymenobacter sp. BT18]QIX61865.1 hypothetical protein HER32_12000 [Hymenobacter sp. BT18]